MTIDPDKLLAGLPAGLRAELMREYGNLVSNFRQQKWEPSELSGAKFCEVVYTILEGYQAGRYAPRAKKPRNFPEACKRLENDPSVPHSMRILIPRVLPGLYDIRNNRSVGHVGGDVNPNHMDASYVSNACKWVLAELVRVFHGVSVGDAQVAVDSIVEKEVPILWKLPNGGVRVLDPKLSMKHRMMLVLYERYPAAVPEPELVASVEHSNASIFRRDIIRISHKAALVHYNADQRTVLLSPTGIRYVEDNLALTI